MAGLQHRSGSYRILFRYQGKQHAFTLGAVSQEEADAKSAQVDYLLLRLRQRLATLPTGVSIVDYVQFDGKPDVSPPKSSVGANVSSSADEPAKTLGTIEKSTLADLREKYLAANRSSLEATTLSGIEIHFRHLTKHIGEAFSIVDLKREDLQAYVDKRAEAKGKNGRKLASATIKKELITLRTAWNWAEPLLVKGKFPLKGVKFPKSTEKPVFMTRTEIERRIEIRHLNVAEIADLWDALYLQVGEIDELLKFVKANANHGFIYPMTCFAAYTGARRSEIVRARVDDVDFVGKIVTINEKKRVRGKTTTRRVPLSSMLAQVLDDWLAIHPGGEYLFCQKPTVARSKKRSPTTGHKGQKTRATTAVLRATMVTRRTSNGVTPLTPGEARDHLDRTLRNGKWNVLKGWHVFRHSFISACASQGIDERLIQEWAGHMTKEMSRRYAHLYPSIQQEALARVFR